MMPFSLFRRKSLARIRLEVAYVSDSINGGRTLDVFIRLGKEENKHLVQCGLTDGENIREAAEIANNYLKQHNFRGDVFLYGQKASGIVPELFKSNLQSFYKNGEVKMDLSEEV